MPVWYRSCSCVPGTIMVCSPKAWYYLFCPTTMYRPRSSPTFRVEYIFYYRRSITRRAVSLLSLRSNKYPTLSLLEHELSVLIVGRLARRKLHQQASSSSVTTCQTNSPAVRVIRSWSLFTLLFKPSNSMPYTATASPWTTYQHTRTSTIPFDRVLHTRGYAFYHLLWIY